VTYKPGAVLSVAQDACYAQVVLRLAIHTLDVHTRAKTELLHSSYYIPLVAFSRLDEQAFLLEVRTLCKRLEFHEVDEWLQLDGKPVVDPHPELTCSRGNCSTAR